MGRYPTLLFLSGAAISGCHRTEHVDINVLSFLQVTVVDGLVTSNEEPADFSAEPVTVRLKVEALNRNAEPFPFAGTLSVKARPADLESDDAATLVEGAWEGDVSFRYPFGPTRIWFTDDQGDDAGREASFVSGVSDAFWFELPTVAQLQATDDHETNPLEGEFAEVRAEDRRVIVVAISLDGMWVTDLDDPPGEYNGLFIYNYNRPEYSSPEGEVDDDLTVYAEPGQQLLSLSGGDQEYLATTQLSFPQFDFVGTDMLEIPDPITLDPDDSCDDDSMEKLEGSLVRAENLSVPDFDSDEGSDFYDYGQWPIQFSNGCEIYAETGGTLPTFYPSDHKGEDLDFIQGMLAEVWGKWIILPRDEADISFPTDTARPGPPPARPQRRPRPRN